MCESGPSIPLTHVQIAGPQLYPPGSLSRSFSENNATCHYAGSRSRPRGVRTPGLRMGAFRREGSRSLIGTTGRFSRPLWNLIENLVANFVGRFAPTADCVLDKVVGQVLTAAKRLVLPRSVGSCCPLPRISSVREGFPCWT